MAKTISPLPRRPPLAGVPWDLVQQAVKMEGSVILAGVLGLLVRHAQHLDQAAYPRSASHFQKDLRPGAGFGHRERADRSIVNARIGAS